MTKDLEQLILSKSRPVQKEVKQLQKSELDRLIVEQLSGQQSERNLVNLINSCASPENPLRLNLGDLGTQEVTGAKQLGGGAPEPKADIAIFTKSNPKGFGISMKKENFAFLENWMDEKKLRTRLKQVDLEDNEVDLIIAEIKEEAKNLVRIMEPVINLERQEFTKVVQSVIPDYSFPDFIGGNQEVINALINSPVFGKNGKFRNSFLIQNMYVTLGGLFGDKYLNFLKLIIGGAKDNPFPAQGVLVVDVEAQDNCEALPDILQKIKSVNAVAQQYMDDPKINIRFRLRPITKVRTTYSKTNRGKYKVGQRLYEDPKLGISWTVSTTK